MTTIKLHNSLTRKKEEFTPIDPEHVRIYACGPTVYNYAHIGNARMAVVFDVLADLLRTVYPKVTSVSNITDVDDKIIAASKSTREPIIDITRKYTEIYNSDMRYLGVRTPDIQPRATDHIEDMVALIEELIENGHAYESQGHVLFNVSSYEKYGALSGRTTEEQMAGARVDIAEYKKDPSDFVLWKPSIEDDDDEPGWYSPWGYGRPGWHIECSAMAQTHLGLPFDIHGGGADLKFPHHENEIAQSCCAHHGDEEDPSSFARYWVHNGFLTVEGEKMSKSLGNVILAHDLIKDHEGEVLRLTLLSAHYRQPLDWTQDALKQSKKTLDRIYQHLRDVEDIIASQTIEVPHKFFNALCDDLNTPKAISELVVLAKKASEQRTPEAKGQLVAAAKMLNIGQKNASKWLGYGVSDKNVSAEQIDAMLKERETARANKDFTRSDQIRDELLVMGIAIEDTSEGTLWKKAEDLEN
ncbi:MAG: cysteine--tRNA ligase [Alphaproteobacteria bacterium]